MFYSESLRMLQVGIDYTFSINADLENPEQGRLHIGRFINKEEFFAYLQSYYEEVSEHLEGDFI
jgi:hypothetical protein